MPILSSATPRTSQLIAQRRQLEAIADARGDAAPAVAGATARGGVTVSTRTWELNLWLLFLILLAIAAITAVLRALTEESGLGWLIAIPALPQDVGDFGVVLAPLLAVAVAVERLLETGFNWYEQSVKTVAGIVSSVRQPIDWIEEELKRAYQAAEAAAAKAGAAADAASLQALDAAEQRLAKAEQRLLGWVKSPEYMAWKRALSIWVGLLVGLEVAVWADFGMLHLIGVPAPRLLDMLVTGLVIGAGPGPMHSLIGILQSGKDALNSVASLAEGKALRDAAASLRSTQNTP